MQVQGSIQRRLSETVGTHRSVVARSMACWSVLLSLVACGDPPTWSEEVETQTRQYEQRLINGGQTTNNSNYVAFYHRGTGHCSPRDGDAHDDGYDYTNMWWPRPCSGILIRKDGNVNFVLTARHCVTVDGSIGGPLLPGDQDMRATSVVNPGVLATWEWNGGIYVGGTPANYTLPTSVYRAYTYVEPDEGVDGAQLAAIKRIGQDLAIVRAVGDLMAPQTPKRIPILAVGSATSDLASLDGKSLRTAAYGRAVAGHCYGHNTSGAGVLRTGAGFTINDPTYATLGHVNPTSNGYEIIGGDSGGPLYFLSVYPEYTWTRLAGVSSTGGRGAGSANLLSWLQSQFGNLYLIDAGSVSTNRIVGSSLTDGSFVRDTYTTDTEQTRIRYVRRQLRFGSWCIEDETLNQPVRTRSCVYRASPDHPQAWDLEADGRITNRITGRCLHSYGGILTTTGCSDNPRRWAFLADHNLN